MKKCVQIKTHLKATEAEETDSGDEMNDDDNDVVLLLLFLL